MAGDWIKVESATPNKPEILRIARLLGINKDEAFGKSMRFWMWVDANSVDGVVDGAASTDVDAVVECEGFAIALSKVGWLDVNDGDEILTIPNFYRHNGETAKERASKAKRQAKWRQNKDADVDAAPSTSASTREEKRREDIKTKDIRQNSGRVSPKVPFQEIIKIYHEILPELPAVGKMTKKREGQIRQRWLFDLKELDNWRNYFNFVRKSDFLMGKTPGSNGKPPFRASLEWLTKESNYVKVYEDNYHG